MFSLIYVWINGWISNREAGDLRRHRCHYDVSVMLCVNKRSSYINCYCIRIGGVIPTPTSTPTVMNTILVQNENMQFVDRKIGICKVSTSYISQTLKCTQWDTMNDEFTPYGLCIYKCVVLKWRCILSSQRIFETIVSKYPTYYIFSSLLRVITLLIIANTCILFNPVTFQIKP